MGELFRKKTITSILREADRPHDDVERPSLRRTLGVRDLIAFGIAAIVGAGIFSTIGKASADGGPAVIYLFRSEEHTSELQSLMRISYAVFCLKKKHKTSNQTKLHLN